MSGGKDSTALALYMRDRVADMEYVFCDTDKELRETYEYLSRVEAFLGKKIVRLNARAGFDHWLDVFGGYLPFPTNAVVHQDAQTETVRGVCRRGPRHQLRRAPRGRRPRRLRANLGNRLVLRVDGEGTSEIALGEKGAERLLGKGHLAARLEGEPGIVFGQVPFVESDFLVRMVAASIQ
jgi:hypothetical protein